MRDLFYVKRSDLSKTLLYHLEWVINLLQFGKSFFIFLFLIIFSIGSINTAFAQETWGWQRGIEADTEQGENYAKITFTIPEGYTNSKSDILNYVFIRTNTDDFIQAGIRYQSPYLILDPFFYSDGIESYGVLNPYREGIKNEISIFYDKGWKVAFLDADVNYYQEFEIDWASGTTISSAGMILENTSIEEDLVLSCDKIGTIDKVKDQKLFFGTNNQNWREAENVRFGYDTTRDYELGEWIVHQQPPPDFVTIKVKGDSYQLGFDCSKQPDIVEQIVEKKSKLPEWVRNVFIWYGDGIVSEDEIINALQFLIKEGIIKI